MLEKKINKVTILPIIMIGFASFVACQNSGNGDNAALAALALNGGSSTSGSSVSTLELPSQLVASLPASLTSSGTAASVATRAATVQNQYGKDYFDKTLAQIRNHGGEAVIQYMLADAAASELRTLAQTNSTTTECKAAMNVEVTASMITSMKLLMADIGMKQADIDAVALPASGDVIPVTARYTAADNEDFNNELALSKTAADCASLDSASDLTVTYWDDAHNKVRMVSMIGATAAAGTPITVQNQYQYIYGFSYDADERESTLRVEGVEGDPTVTGNEFTNMVQIAECEDGAECVKLEAHLRFRETVSSVVTETKAEIQGQANSAGGFIESQIEVNGTTQAQYQYREYFGSTGATDGLESCDTATGTCTAEAGYEGYGYADSSYDDGVDAGNGAVTESIAIDLTAVTLTTGKYVLVVAGGNPLIDTVGVVEAEDNNPADGTIDPTCEVQAEFYGDKANVTSVDIYKKTVTASGISYGTAIATAIAVN